MKSNDLNIEITNLYNKKFYANLEKPIGEETKTVDFKDYSDTIYEYTCRKLYEANHQEDLVYDLGFLFDRLDNYFKTEEEKEKFYETYAHKFIEYLGTIIDKQILWEIVESNSYNEYPKYNEEKYLTFVQTTAKTSNKDTALWLWNEIIIATKEKDKSKGKEK
jgi:hypothetical protein